LLKQGDRYLRSLFVAGVLHSKFGPASKSYFDATRAVTNEHRYGNLN
jgi:hypothetical protein